MSETNPSDDADTAVTACVIVIGNEILSGRTRDENIQFLAEHLNDAGVRLREVRVIPDVEATIIDTVNACRATFDYVITTGGIGPTHDDITSASVAKAFGVELEVSDDAVARMTARFPARKMNAARLRMAHVPAGAVLIDNPISAAPGFKIANVLVLAGVPMIMRAMFDSLRHHLAGGAPMLSRTVTAFVAEGDAAPGLSALQDRYGDLELGSYPFMRQSRFGASIVLRGTDAARLDAAAAEVGAMLRALGGDPIEEDATATQTAEQP